MNKNTLSPASADVDTPPVASMPADVVTTTPVVVDKPQSAAGGGCIQKPVKTTTKYRVERKAFTAWLTSQTHKSIRAAESERKHWTRQGIKSRIVMVTTTEEVLNAKSAATGSQGNDHE